MASPAVLYQTGTHAGRPANGSGCVLYACTTHNLVYLDDGTSWSTFATLVPSGTAGAIVQVKTAVSTADDVTTAATMQDSSLSLAFTPLFSDSILHVNVDGECSAVRAAGTIAERYMWVGILNSTNAVELKREVRGRTLIGTSAVAAVIFEPIALKGLYTVNSLAARTFKFQFMAGAVTNIQAGLNGSRIGGITMTIAEVRP